MRHGIERLVVVGLVLAAVGCATPDQRSFYRKAIDQYATKNPMPKSSQTCWLAADLAGPGAGSDAIAEEVFSHYMLEKGLCRIVEKHPDATAGYDRPKEDVCPCQKEGGGPTAICGAAAGSSAGGGLGGFSIGSSVAADDNNRSSDLLLERYKKNKLPQKLITFRIDELTAKKCVVHFRVSDTKSAIIEQSDWIKIEEEQASARD